MFICSIRASTIRYTALLLLCTVVFLGALVSVGENTVEAASYNYAKIKSDVDRVAFLKQFGWQTTTEAPVEEESFTIPKEFDRVMLGYNEIQKSQGLDLARYHNKKVTRYTYEISNYEGYEGKVYANILIYRDKVVAGDICSADPMAGGFVHGFEKTVTENNS